MPNKQINDFLEVPLDLNQNILIQTDGGTTQRIPSDEIKDAVDDVVTLNSDVGTLQSDVSTLQTDVSTLQTDVSAIEILSRNNASTALIEGCELSINGGDPALFDVAAGVLQVIDNVTDPINPVITKISFGAVSGVTVTNLATEEFTYLGIDSSGTLNQFANPTAEEIRTNAIIGVLFHSSGTQIDEVSNETIVPAVNVASSYADLSRALGTLNVEGNVFAPNGSNLNIDKSSGLLYVSGINTKTDLGNPNNIITAALTALTFTYSWRDGAGGFNEASGQTLINPANYDDGTGGVGTPNGSVPANNWTIQRVFLSHSNNVSIQYGQALYSTKAAAIDGIFTEPFTVSKSLDKYSLRCYLISRGGASDLSIPGDAQFLTVGRFGDSGLSGASLSTTSLQQAYNNSTGTEITTDVTHGALTISDGTAGANNILDVQDASNVPMLLVKPDGTINLGNVQSGSGGLSTGDVYHVAGDLQIVL